MLLLAASVVVWSVCFAVCLKCVSCPLGGLLGVVRVVCVVG